MLTERFEQALIFAARTHARQKRKGVDIPYFAHLMSVSALVLEHGGHEEEAIAALLHDAVEDQGGAAMHQRIVETFGPTIAEIVAGCTESDQSPQPPWLERKRAYLKQVAAAGPSVRLVAAADKVHNARSILADYKAHGDRSFKRFKGGKEGTVWYYRSVVEMLSSAEPLIAPSLVEELSRIVEEMELLTGIRGRDIDIDALLDSAPKKS